MRTDGKIFENFYTLGNFYNDLESYDFIKKSVQISINTINGIKTDTETAKKDLENKNHL